MTQREDADAVCDAAVRAISDLLADFGVRPGEPDARDAMARRAEKAGMTLADAKILERWFMERESREGIHEIGGIVAAALSTKKKWEPLLVDARRVMDKRDARKVDQGNIEGQRNRMTTNVETQASIHHMSEQEWKVYDWERSVIYFIQYDRPHAHIKDPTARIEAAVTTAASEFKTTRDRVLECLRKHPDIGEKREEPKEDRR